MLDMGPTPVKGTVSHALKVTNTGDAAVNCNWEIGSPFSMIPEAATIEANQSFTFTCHFQPAEASVYTALAACHADTGYTATVKVSLGQNMQHALTLTCDTFCTSVGYRHNTHFVCGGFGDAAQQLRYGKAACKHVLQMLCSDCHR